MRRYVGPAGCPGCETPGTERVRPGKDAICEQCQKHLRLGRGVLESVAPGYSLVRVNRFASFYDHIKLVKAGSEGRDTETFPPSYYVTGHYERDGSVDQFFGGMVDILVAANAGIKASYDYYLTLPGAGQEIEVAVSTPIVLAFTQFLKASALYSGRIAEEQYARGLKEGSAFVVGLATGAVNIDKFNEMSKKR